VSRNCSVPQIALYGDCSYGDVCRDENAECRADSCQCVAGYTDRYGRCGKSVVVFRSSVEHVKIVFFKEIE